MQKLLDPQDFHSAARYWCACGSRGGGASGAIALPTASKIRENQQSSCYISKSKHIFSGNLCKATHKEVKSKDFRIVRFFFGVMPARIFGDNRSGSARMPGAALMCRWTSVWVIDDVF